MSSLVDLVKNDSRDWYQIRQLIRSDSTILQKPICEGQYLLHYACARNASSELVIEIINQYPKACEEKDNKGYLPLHAACGNSQSESVIQLLLLKYPKACEVKTGGWLPLHYACCYNQSEPVLRLLLSHYPKACEIKNNHDMIPFHYVCQKHHSESVIRFFCTKYPKSCQVASYGGKLALHYACASNKPLAVIQFLVQQWPKALTTTDKTNKDPIDLALTPQRGNPNQDVILWLQNYTATTTTSTTTTPATKKRFMKFFKSDKPTPSTSPYEIVRRVQRLPSNTKCCDCTAKLPNCVNVTIGSFVCITCAGIHREELAHRVKFVGHSSFTQDEADFISSTDNDKINAKYLALFDSNNQMSQPFEGDTPRIRQWIIRKYRDRAFYSTESSNTSPNPTTTTTTTTNYNNDPSNNTVQQDPYIMTATERARYEQIFDDNFKDEQYCYGAKAVQFFSKSGLNQQQLSVIWTMSDYDPVDNRLDKIEFIIAMHLVVCVAKRNLPVPVTLPSQLKQLKTPMVNNDIHQQSPYYSYIRQQLCDFITTNSNDWDQMKQLIEFDNGLIAKVSDNEGRYLLHYACQKYAPPEFVIQLINHYPKACEEKTNDDWYALHIACAFSQSESVIQLLITVYSKALEAMNNNGHLPLHLALRNSQSDSVLQFLVTTHPEACQRKDKDGYLPIHYACYSDQSVPMIQLLITKYPKACDEKTNNGWLPIHVACAYNASLSLIQLFVQQYPDSLSITDRDNKTPLDYARNPLVDYKNPTQEAITWLENYTLNTMKPENILLKQSLLLLDLVDIEHPNWIEIQQLVWENTDLIKRPIDNDGQYVLHYACQKNAPSDLVIQLIEYYPKACEEKDWYGFPLHYACRANQSESVIQLLITKYPKACKEKTIFGDLPLHLACASHVSLLVIQLLFQQWPDSIYTTNSDNKTPLDYARNTADNKSPNEETIIWLEKQVLSRSQPSLVELVSIDSPDWTTIQQLVQSNNELMQQQIDTEGRYLLHYACWKKAPVSIISEFIDTYPLALEQKDNTGWYPLHMTCCHYQVDTVIKLLITKNPKAIRMETDKGLLPLHLACAGNVSLSVIQLLFLEWPDSIYKTDSYNKTPLDYARNPSDSKIPKPKTIAWLETMTSSPLSEKDTYDADRKNVQNTIQQRNCQAVVSEQYIEHIIVPGKKLGAGYFGTVYLGIDTKLNNQHFAIKTINNEILSNGTSLSAENVQKIVKTFHNEQQVLMNFQHPNIATLLAYSFPKNDIMGNYCLVYEYAERGSLDVFWKDEAGREQLNFRRRVIIAYEVMTALRFLHEGNDKFVSCFHRDLKSANIVLKQNLSAQLIDCGLAKFITDDDNRKSSTGVKGTPGYICPEYVDRGQGYEPACDIFSYGVVLTELFTGKLQNHEISSKSVFNFSREYIKKKKPRSLVDDIDKLSGYGDVSNLPMFVNDFAHLALDCMSQDIEDRPEGLEVMNRLKEILNSVHAGTTYPLFPTDDVPVNGESMCDCCRTYKVYLNHNICNSCYLVDLMKQLSLLLELLNVDAPNWTKIQQLIWSNKDLISRPIDDDRQYLLHYACKKNAPSEFVNQIINYHSEACEAKTNYGWLPLHLACGFNQSESVLQLLITTYSKALEEKTNDFGFLPLHLACQSNQSESVVRLLITEFPKACEEKNMDGKLPVHCALSAFHKQLPVIQLLLQQWPKALFETDNDNRNPLDYARNPSDGCTDPAIISLVEKYISDISEKDNHDKDRRKVQDTIKQRNCQAVVSEQYIEHIIVPGKKLGAGYFGTVYLGIDTKLSNQHFAIKTINNEILSNGTSLSAENVQKIVKTFHNEQQVLMNFQHPNIATLLAYSFPKNDISGNYYLVYEYAERGSLDVFWKDEAGREQLNFRRRVIIAYEVMTALRFLHEGNDKFVSCFHRDLKSANIVLKQNLSAQLIDCGLAKFITDDDNRKSSTGVKGTPGYICPEYVERGQGYEPACDIFSYGVVLTELFTGKLQNHEISSKSVFNFSREYIKKKKPRSLVDDIDKLSGYGDVSNLPMFVNDFANLALDCMSQDIEDRPEGLEVMNRLNEILNCVHAGTSNPLFPPPNDVPGNDVSFCDRCRTYKKYRHHNICHPCHMVDIVTDIKNKVDMVLVKLDEIMPILTTLDVKFNNSIPRLFILYPANLKSFWSNPKSWLRSHVVDTYHLQFICAYSFQAIEPPLKIRIVKGWMEKVAPVLAVSLYLMSMALKGAANFTIDVSGAANQLYKIGKDQLRDLLVNVYAILDTTSTIDYKKCIEGNDFINVLDSKAYDEVKEVAYQQNKWQENMVLVKKLSSAGTLWVAKTIASNESNGYTVVNV